MILFIILGLSLAANLIGGFFLFKFLRKLLQFDELVELLADEVNINIGFFDKLLQKPLFMASPEIEEAHQNMNLMRERFKEFVSQMSELSGKDFNPRRLPAAPSPRPPVVVD